jgi:trehalose 6-phosphate phosphatase
MGSDTLRDWSQTLDTVGLFTDIDGTLAPIVPTPDMSEVPEELRELLRRLSERCRIVAGVSGRAPLDARRLVGLGGGVVYHGNHGFEVLAGDGEEVEVVPEAVPYAAKVRELEDLAREALGPEGVFVEDKGITASVHYRNVPPEVGERAVAFVKAEGERLGLRITVGRGVVEARPPVRADKGTAVRHLVERYGPERALFVGDDTTDLDAFQELALMREEGVLREAINVGVRSDEGPPEIVTQADIVVDGVEGVAEVFRTLLGES